MTARKRDKHQGQGQGQAQKPEVTGEVDGSGQEPDQPLSESQADAGQSGQDERRRGWFWHWNTIITQYAPLIGLKGVGLLNSYTVWTDRRDSSPYRGYAFPSQQSEADFYGEDRAELITINKILVALDLIEIRKEMVVRPDERGRRWRVPHNLYRVKDHPEGYQLTSAAVLRVANLASRDRSVYRYLRRIFSQRFAPIDRQNVWHQILAEVRQDPIWQALAARAEREDAQASARTKAGHARRSGGIRQQRMDSDSKNALDPTNDDHPASRVSQSEAPATTADAANDGSTTSVEPGNNGYEPVVADANSGFRPIQASSAGQSNNGSESTVEPSNRTQDQEIHTTTTTTSEAGQSTDRTPALRPAAVARPSFQGRSDTVSPPAGPLPSPSPNVLACYEAANDRPATPLEVQLLGELEGEFGRLASGGAAAGGEWLVAAIREAVGSGSRFVAPKRIREILSRWAGSPADRPVPLRPGQAAPAPGSSQLAPSSSPNSSDTPDSSAVGRTPDGTFRSDDGGAIDPAWASIWDETLRRLARSLDQSEMERIFAGSAIAAAGRNAVTISVCSATARDKVRGEYDGLVKRSLRHAAKRSLSFDVMLSDAPGAGSAAVDASPAQRAGRRPGQFVLPGGLTGRQLWAAAQADLALRLSSASFESWVRPAQLLGRDEAGDLIVGAPNAFARSRLEPLLGDIRASLSSILEAEVSVRLVVTGSWLGEAGPAGDSER